MSVKTELEKKIEKEKQKITDLRSQLEKAESFVAGLQEALRMMPKEGSIDKKPEPIMRHGSDMYKVREYLRSVGKAMYINDILKGIGKDLTPNNKTSISGSLDNYARREEVFTKIAPRTYGLIEFGNILAHEPPADFGVHSTQQTDDAEF